MLSPNITQVVKEEFGVDEWNKLQEKVRKTQGFGDGVRGKNAFLIAQTLETAYKEKGPSSSLGKVVSGFLRLAEMAHSSR